MRQFNLEEAKAGKPVCTRNGREAKLIYEIKDEKDIYPMIVLVIDPEGYGTWIPRKYALDGRYDLSRATDYDLFMVDDKKEVCVNIFRSLDKEPKYFTSDIFTSEEEARKYSKICKNYVSTIRIEWEE